MTTREKPRLLFLRPALPGLPDFIQRHLHEQTRCLAHFFDVVEVAAEGDYRALCERHRPDISLFESGVYTKAPRIIATPTKMPKISRNMRSSPIGQSAKRMPLL